MHALDGFLRVARALGDRTRVQILVALNERSLCVCELVSLVDLGQPAVSRHLGILEDAGLVDSVRDGRWVNYRIREDDLEPFAIDTLRSVRALVDRVPALAELGARAHLADRRRLAAAGFEPCKQAGAG